MPQDLTDDKSTLVQVMAWCRQATSHYLNQCWPRSLSPYGVTRPQCVNMNVLYFKVFDALHACLVWAAVSWVHGMDAWGVLAEVHQPMANVPYYTLCFNEVERGVYWFHVVRLPVCLSVCGQNHVRSVSSTILVISILYLHILSSNFRKCVMCKGYCKIPKFEFLANFWNL